MGTFLRHSVVLFVTQPEVALLFCKTALLTKSPRRNFRALEVAESIFAVNFAIASRPTVKLKCRLLTAHAQTLSPSPKTAGVARQK